VAADAASMMPVVLVVEDHEPNRYFFTRVLTGAGYRVLEAATGAAALELAGAQQPDAILLDVYLPDTDGFTVCRTLKADPATSAIPVLQISAQFTRQQDRTRGLDGGADGFLVQPAEPEELLATVRALLRTRTVEKALREVNEAIEERVRVRTIELEDANQALEEEVRERQRVERALREANQFVTSCLDALPDSIAILAADGTIVAVNRTWRRFGEESGGPDALCEGRNYFTVCSDAAASSLPYAAGAAEVESGIRSVAAGEIEEFLWDYPCPSPHETDRWFQVRVTRFSWDGPVRLAVAHTDITARRRAETRQAEALRDRESALAASRINEDRYRAMARHFPNGAVALLDQDLRYLVVDGTALAPNGLSAEQMEGRTIFQILPDDLAHTLEAPYRTALAGEEAAVEIALGDRAYLVRAHPVRDADGAVVSCLVMSQDITEQKVTLEALRTSEERFRALTEHSTDGILLVDRAGNISYASTAVRAILGRQPADLIGQNGFDLVHPDDLAAAYETLAAIVQQPGSSANQTLRLQHTNGNWRWIEAVGNNQLDNPVIRAVVVNYRDITARRQAEDDLRHQQENFQLLVEHSSDILTILTEDGTILYQSASCEHVLGYHPEDHIGDNVFDGNLVHPDDLSRKRDFFRQLQEVPSDTVRAEFRMRHADGSWRMTEVVGRNLLSHPLVRGIVANYRDISERLIAEQQLREAEDQQRGFVRDVLYSVSEGRLRLCLRPEELPAPLPQEQNEEIPLSTLTLGDVRNRVREAAAACDFPEDRWQDLMAAASECAMNAVQHGGIGATASVRADVTGDQLQVWVRDNGRGIDVSDLPKATLMKGYSGSSGFGHGFFLMLQYVDTIYLMTGASGTTVVLEQAKVPPLSEYPFRL